MATCTGVLAENQIEGRGNPLNRHLTGALETAGNLLDLLPNHFDLLQVHLAHTAFMSGLGNHNLFRLITHDLSRNSLAGHQVLGANNQIHLLGLAEDGTQSLLTERAVHDLENRLEGLAPVYHTLDQSLLVEVLFLHIRQ